MKLLIESPRCEAGEKLVQQIENRFAHLDKIHGHINHCDVVLKREKNSQQKSCSIEARVEVPGSLLFAMEKEETFECALTKLVEDLEHQLRRYKEEFAQRR